MQAVGMRRISTIRETADRGPQPAALAAHMPVQCRFSHYKHADSGSARTSDKIKQQTICRIMLRGVGVVRRRCGFCSLLKPVNRSNRISDQVQRSEEDEA